MKAVIAVEEDESGVCENEKDELKRHVSDGKTVTIEDEILSDESCVIEAANGPFGVVEAVCWEVFEKESDIKHKKKIYRENRYWRDGQLEEG